MVREYKSITITPEQQKFLDENPNFNLSAWIQVKLEEEMNKERVNMESYRDLLATIEYLREKQNRFYQFLNQKGIIDAFLNWEKLNIEGKDEENV